MNDPLAAYLHDHLAGARYAIDLVEALRDHFREQPLGHFAEAYATLSLYVGGLLAKTLLGWATGGVSAGVLADLFRSRMLMISILRYAAFAGLTAVSSMYWFRLVFLFLTGL